MFIYLDKSCESAPVDDGGLFQPQIHYLPDLVAALSVRHPDSPLLSVLRPLLTGDEHELTSHAVADYENLQRSTALTDAQREAWLDVFHYRLMIRLHKTIEEIRQMVLTQLPEVEELPWGKQLKQRWTAEGRAARLREDVARAEEELRILDELSAAGQLSEPAYRRLRELKERTIQQAQAELGRIESAPRTAPASEREIQCNGQRTSTDSKLA